MLESEQRRIEQRSIVHDSRLFSNVLPQEMQQTVFQTLQDELNPLWSEMFHKGGAVPRLVCLQGDVISVDGDKVDDGGTQQTMIPLYRHPCDEHPTLHQCTPTVAKLRDIASNVVGQTLNHALIQMYRGGDDYISEHADKTLDIERGSDIVNFSIGATRTLILRPKKGDEWEKGKMRPSTRVTIDHASLFVLGWETNKVMTHEIRRDKRNFECKMEGEKAFGGVRISLTFRKVATFLREDGTLIGQGAPKDNVSSPPLSRVEEEELLLDAFSTENRKSDYDWDELYGNGFSVVNFQMTNQPESSADKEA